MKKALAEEEKVATQMLLIPEVVDLSLSEKARIMENAADLEKLGLVVEEFWLNGGYCTGNSGIDC